MPSVTPITRRPVEILVAPDGTGDYPTLAAAVAAAPEGATIQLKRGTYTLTTGLALSKANLTIRGEGPRATILAAPLAATTAISITAADVTLQALQIDGRRALQPGIGAGGVGVTGTAETPCARVTLRDCYIHSVKQNGVTATYTEDLLIERCRVTNHATNGTTWGGAGSLKGIYVERSARNVIRNCFLSGWSQAVGWWTNATDCSLIDSHLVDNYGFEDDAATIRRSAVEDFGNGNPNHGRNQVLNCLIDGATSYCIECAQGVVGSQYIGNVLRNPGKLGGAVGFFSVTGAGTLPGDITTDILVADNYCESDGSKVDYGDVNNASRILLRGNWFVGCNHADIPGTLLIQGTAPQGVSIEQNVFHNCQAPIRLLAAGPGVIIRGNRITGGGHNGNCILVNDGAGHLIEGNVLAISGSTGEHGIVIEATAGAGCRVLGNRVTVPGCPLIIRTGAVAAQGNWLEETVAAANGTFQLNGATAAKCVVRDNHLTSPSKGGYLTAGALNNRVTDNFFLGAASDITTTGSGSGNTTTPNY